MSERGRLGWFPTARVTPLRGGPSLRWGILGPGSIADSFAATTLANTDQRIVAVGSRSRDRAEAFAHRHGVPQAHAGYERLVSDPNVDIIYIATPHSEHQAQALLAIQAGKHVLVEKPIAITGDGAEEIVQAAERAGVFVGEALWTRYLPKFDVVDQVVRRGDLGDVRLVTADVGWRKDPNEGGRFFDSGGGGGALLDMGVYGVWLVQHLLGSPARVTVTGSSRGADVDVQSVIGLETADGRLGVVTTTMEVTSSGLAGIHGTRGALRFTRPFVFPGPFTVTVGDDEHTWRDRSELRRRDGLAWQATAVADYITQGLTDSRVHPIAGAVAVLRTIDTARARLNEVSGSL